MSSLELAQRSTLFNYQVLYASHTEMKSIAMNVLSMKPIELQVNLNPYTLTRNSSLKSMIQSTKMSG